MWLIDANIFYSSERHRYGQGFFNQSGRRDASDGMLTFSSARSFSSYQRRLGCTCPSERIHSLPVSPHTDLDNWRNRSCCLFVFYHPSMLARQREKRETEETPDWSINALIDFADFRRSHLINVRECTCTRISSTRYTFSPYNQISARFEKLICIFFFPLYFRMLASKKKETINWPTNVHENESSLVDERLCS